MVHQPVYGQKKNKNETAAVQTKADVGAKQQIPQKVLTVLSYVETHRQAMKGYVGGRTFENREQRLPLSDARHQRINYQEWDVNPKVAGQNRGPERLITGSNQSAWYTANHYKTFLQIK
jgi:guanyl-specific ribonuclease Sa